MIDPRLVELRIKSRKLVLEADWLHAEAVKVRKAMPSGSLERTEARFIGEALEALLVKLRRIKIE